MVIFTVPPSILYLPSTPFPEKLPEVVSPLKVALFSFATFSAADTNALGLFVVFMLKVRSPPRLTEEDPASRTDLRGRRWTPFPRRIPLAITTALSSICSSCCLDDICSLNSLVSCLRSYVRTVGLQPRQVRRLYSSYSASGLPYFPLGKSTYLPSASSVSVASRSLAG